MPTDPSITAEDQVDSAVSDVTTPTTPTKPIDWEAKFNGLQGTALQHKQRAAKLADELSQLNTKHESALLDASELNKTKAQLETELAQTKAEAEALRGFVKVGKEIQKDFPKLADLYTGGFILGVDTMEPEARKTFLTDYQARLDALGANQTQQTIGGAVPPGVGVTETAVETSLQIGEKMNAAYREFGGKSKEYKDLYAKYSAALMKEKRKA